MRIVCSSDTHDLHAGLEIPDGDVLIHAGDLTGHGSLEEVARAHAFLAALPHRHKIVIAGNVVILGDRDFAFERDPTTARALMTGCTYLQDEEVEVEGLRLWGSPWQPWFYDWAFNLQRGAEIRAKWDLILEGIDLLVTHGPPAGHGDVTADGTAVGCEDLLAAVRRVRPRWHVFGHIHEGYGTSHADGTTFINASTCTFAYEPTHAAIVVETE